MTVQPACNGWGDGQPDGHGVPVADGDDEGDPDAVVVTGAGVLAEGDADGVGSSPPHAVSASSTTATAGTVRRIGAPPRWCAFAFILSKGCDRFQGVRRLLALAVLSVALHGVAGAHMTARLRVASPGDGSTVSGDRVRVVVVGEGGDANATFRMTLDGKTVDATGTVGGVFSTLTVAPGSQLTLDVPVAPGEHTLVVEPTFDPDSPQERITLRFTVVEDTGGSPVAYVLAGVAVLAGVGAAVAVRRKAAAQQQA